MSKEVETVDCEVCESHFKIVYNSEGVSGFPKFCPFCSSELFLEKEEQDDPMEEY